MCVFRKKNVGHFFSTFEICLLLIWVTLVLLSDDGNKGGVVVIY
jgi:hypothetical protein